MLDLLSTKLNQKQYHNFKLEPITNTTNLLLHILVRSTVQIHLLGFSIVHYKFIVPIVQQRIDKVPSSKDLCDRIWSAGIILKEVLTPKKKSVSVFFHLFISPLLPEVLPKFKQNKSSIITVNFNPLGTNLKEQQLTKSEDAIL